MIITEAYVAGLNQENARRLLDRAHEMGLPASVVRTVDGGFIVPAVLVENNESADDTSEEESDTTSEPKARKSTTRRAAAKKSADDSTADAVASEE